MYLANNIFKTRLFSKIPTISNIRRRTIAPCISGNFSCFRHLWIRSVNLSTVDKTLVTFFYTTMVKQIKFPVSTVQSFEIPAAKSEIVGADSARSATIELYRVPQIDSDSYTFINSFAPHKQKFVRCNERTIRVFANNDFSRSTSFTF